LLCAVSHTTVYKNAANMIHQCMYVCLRLDATLTNLSRVVWVWIIWWMVTNAAVFSSRWNNKTCCAHHRQIQTKTTHACTPRTIPCSMSLNFMHACTIHVISHVFCSAYSWDCSSSYGRPVSVAYMISSWWCATYLTLPVPLTSPHLTLCACHNSPHLTLPPMTSLTWCATMYLACQLVLQSSAWMQIMVHMETSLLAVTCLGD
jgi:hypothetical protein